MGVPIGESPGGSNDVEMMEEDEDDSYRDLPLNLVATQMAETETH